MYLIDTDWVIDYLKGIERAGNLVGSLVNDGISISLITYGEFFEGIYYGGNPEQHELVFRALLQDVSIVPLSENSMELFAHIRGDLRSRGQIIGDADLLIAATALEHDLTLVTQNLRHFNRIPNLKLYQSY